MRREQATDAAGARGARLPESDASEPSAPPFGSFPGATRGEALPAIL